MNSNIVNDKSAKSCVCGTANIYILNVQKIERCRGVFETLFFQVACFKFKYVDSVTELFIDGELKAFVKLTFPRATPFLIVWGRGAHLNS